MIIGINGKIGSGKDTVGKIIQFLVANKNLPKDMQYVSLEELDGVVNVYSNWEIKKFAGKLKQIASLLTGIDIEDFEDQEFKKSHLGSEWGTVRSNPLNAVPVFEDVQFNHLMSVRELLQKLGTEAMRDGLHTNVWVNALFADYKMSYTQHPDIEYVNHKAYPNWIITDMRFPNELEAVVEKGGITIRVSRTGIHTPKVEDLHPSETSLDDVEFNYHIDNSGTIEDLIEKVEEILIKSGVI
jgi:hypothetical protein